MSLWVIVRSFQTVHVEPLLKNGTIQVQRVVTSYL